MDNREYHPLDLNEDQKEEAQNASRESTTTTPPLTTRGSLRDRSVSDIEAQRETSYASPSSTVGNTCSNSEERTRTTVDPGEELSSPPISQNQLSPPNVVDRTLSSVWNFFFFSNLVICFWLLISTFIKLVRDTEPGKTKIFEPGILLILIGVTQVLRIYATEDEGQLADIVNMTRLQVICLVFTIGLSWASSYNKS